MGSVLIAATSPYTDAKCKRRLPVASGGPNTFAILVDFDATLGQDVKCFFPEFKITAGMSFSVEMKAVLAGNSYSPDLTNGRQYGSVYRTTSNTLSFATAIPDMSSSYVTTMSSLTETPSFYSTAMNVGSSFTSTYTVSGSWSSSLSTPFAYVNYMKAGPVPAVSLCSDPNTFFECRVYNKLLNLVVAKLKSTSTTTFSMSRGTMDISYPKSQFNVGSDFNSYAYISNGNQWRFSRSFTGRAQSSLTPISTNTFLAFHDLFGSSRSAFRTTALLSINIAGKTLYSRAETGSMLTVSFSGITQKNNCQVWVQNEPDVQLKCTLDANLLTIYSPRTDYTTSNNIFVSFGITNPSTSPSFNMILYDYYYSGSRYSKVIEKPATLTVDNSFFTNTALAKERVSMYPYRSRFSLTANAPFRIRFKLSSGSVAYAAVNSGLFQITNAQIAYSTKFIIIFRQYANYQNMNQQTQMIEMMASSYTVSGSTLTIYPPLLTSISSAYYYEL